MPFGEKVSGVKTNLITDTPELPHAIHITTTDMTNRDGAIAGSPPIGFSFTAMWSMAEPKEKNQKSFIIIFFVKI